MSDSDEHGYLIGRAEDPKNWGIPANTKGGIWAPLEKVIAPAYRANFVFMGVVTSQSGTEISLYQHDMSHEYVNVDADGRLYEWTGPGNVYLQITLSEARFRLVSGLVRAIEEGIDISADSKAISENLNYVRVKENPFGPAIHGTKKRPPAY
jgi:hypothetical protein